MPGQRQKYFISTLLSLGLGLSSFSIHAADNNSSRLKEIRSDISHLKQSIGSDKKQQKSLQNELRKLEKEIAGLSRQQRNTDKKLKSQKKEQKALIKQQAQLNKKHAQQQDNLGQQIRAAHSAGQQQTLKLILNQNNPAELSRTMTYYGYFTEAQSGAIEDTQENLAAVVENKKQLEQSTQRLQKLRQEQTKQQRALGKRQTDRKTVLVELDKNISSKEQRLQQLQEDEQALSKLVEEIRRRSATLAKPSNLAQLKKKLKWPTQGKIRNRFGTSRNQAGMKWQGVTIAGKEGQEVRSIAAGKVVYADWIRGYGLMLIVDHGHQYMSIYSHNQSLYKDVGDMVRRDEVVASLGNSGGKTDHALYFEVRHKGKPVNPARWCK